MLRNKLIIRDEDGALKVWLDNGRRRIGIMGVARVHFITGYKPEIVVTLRADEVDAEVEISEAMAHRIRLTSGESTQGG